MATVHLQLFHARLTGGRRTLTVAGATVGDLIDDLDRRHPGLGELLRKGSSVAIDSAIVANGDYEPVGDDTEVHFIAKVTGG